MLGSGRRRIEYSGTGTYRHVEPLLGKARELYVISPFIDAYYAKFLSRGIRARKVYILSSSIGPEAESLLRSRRSVAPLCIAVVIAVANAVPLFYGLFSPYIVAASAMASCLLLLAYAADRLREPVVLKRPHGVYHMKMYVSDKKAIKGSANLTYAGMHRNHESVSVFSDRADVESMRREFWRIWNSG